MKGRGGGGAVDSRGRCGQWGGVAHVGGVAHRHGGAWADRPRGGIGSGWDRTSPWGLQVGGRTLS